MMEQLTKTAKNVIPSLDTILDEAWEQLKPAPRYVNNNFGKIWVSLDRTATKIFRDYEREALSTLAVSWLNQQEKDLGR